MIDKTKFLLEVMKLEFLYRVELKKYNVLNIIGIGKKGKIIADSLTNSEYNSYFKIFSIPSGISHNSCIETLNHISKNHFDEKWLFTILNIEDLTIAKVIAEYTKNSQSHLSLFFIVCPSADDIRLAKIPNESGTWIILPKDKIIESNLDENILIYQLIDMIANTVQGVIPKKPNTSTYRPSEYFFTKSMQNRGKAYIGWSEISAASEEMNFLKVAKKAINSPLMMGKLPNAQTLVISIFGNTHKFPKNYPFWEKLTESISYVAGLSKTDSAYLEPEKLNLIYEYNDDDKISGLKVLLIATHLDE